MWPELIDICENFQKLTGTTANDAQSNEIKNYYLSDTLLQMPTDLHYYELINKAIYDQKEQTSAGYITAMTKAHLKDGAIDHGLKFF